MVPDMTGGKLRFEPADDILDRGVELNDGLKLVWNKTRTDLSINTIEGDACVMHCEVHDGKIECMYFDMTFLD
jgi:hypothetical protein